MAPLQPLIFTPNSSRRMKSKPMYYYINVDVDSPPHESSSTEKTNGPPNDKSKPSSSSSSNLIVVENEAAMFDEELNRHVEAFTTNINHEIHLEKEKNPYRGDGELVST
jgi:hypothetical protein